MLSCGLRICAVRPGSIIIVSSVLYHKLSIYATKKIAMLPNDTKNDVNDTLH